MHTEQIPDRATALAALAALAAAEHPSPVGMAEVQAQLEQLAEAGAERAVKKP